MITGRALTETITLGSQDSVEFIFGAALFYDLIYVRKIRKGILFLLDDDQETSDGYDINQVDKDNPEDPLSSSLHKSFL